MGCDSIRLNLANSFDGKFERSVVALFTYGAEPHMRRFGSRGEIWSRRTKL
jgi:hypothetical protein